MGGCRLILGVRVVMATSSLGFSHSPIRLSTLQNNILQAVTNLERPYENTLVITTAPDISSGSSAIGLITGAGVLRKFVCDMAVEDSGVGVTNSAVRSTFYDVSGSPTGTEPILFSILSGATFPSSGTSVVGETQHDLDFRGITFENGIGVICEQVINTPLVTAVSATIFYDNQ